MTETEFLNCIDPVPEHNYFRSLLSLLVLLLSLLSLLSLCLLSLLTFLFYFKCSRFVKADYSFEQDAATRAYINFVNPDDIFVFQERFDGYVFVDKKGRNLLFNGLNMNLNKYIE